MVEPAQFIPTPAVKLMDLGTGLADRDWYNFWHGLRHEVDLLKQQVGGGDEETWPPPEIVYIADVVADASSGFGTDNQPVIQAAIDARAGEPTNFILPMGFIAWAGTVTLGDNQRLMGWPGYGPTRLVRLPGLGSGEYFIKIGAVNSGAENLFLYACTGDLGGVAIGRHTTTPNVGGVGGSNDGPEQARIRHIKVTAFNRTTGRFYGGINIDGVGNGADNYGSRDCLIEDCEVHSCTGYGIRVAGTNNLRMVGVDVTSPDNLIGNPGTLPGGSINGDIWITGQAGADPYQNSDTVILASTCDDINMENAGDTSIFNTAIGHLYLASTCASTMVVCSSIDGVHDFGSTNTQIFAGPTIHYAINATGGISAASITNSGNHTMSSTQPQFSMNAASGNGANGIFFTEAGAGRWAIRPRYDVSDRLYIPDGDETHGVYLDQNTVAGWVLFSDGRLKSEQKPVSVLARMKQQPGLDYLYSFKLHGRESIGPIAQKLHKVFPEAVTPGNDDGEAPLEPDTKLMDPRVWGVGEARTGTIALQGVKELLERIEALEHQVKELSNGTV